MLPFLKLPKIKGKLEKPPETLTGKAILAAKPYLEKAKGNPAAEGLVSTLALLIQVAEMSKGFQEGFEEWLKDVERIRDERKE